MGFLIHYLSIYAPWVYAICGLIALYHIYKLWQVRAERRQAIFSLEREKALKDLYHIFFVCMVLLSVMGLTYFSSTVLARAVDPIVAEALAPAPTPLNGLPTPSPTPLPATPTPLATPTPSETDEEDAPDEGGETEDVATDIEPVVTEVVPPTDTPAPVVAAPACPDPRAVLTSPGNGAVVSGLVSVSGTATHEQFQYYKLEYAPGGGASEGFVYLAGGNSPVSGGVLGTFDSAALGNGTWTLRIVVVDLTGNFPPPCQVTITVQN